jgi:hypothetical protein
LDGELSFFIFVSFRFVILLYLFFEPSEHFEHFLLVLLLHLILEVLVVEHLDHDLAVLLHLFVLVGQVEVLIVLPLLDEDRVISALGIHVRVIPLIIAFPLSLFFFDLFLYFFFLEAKGGWALSEVGLVEDTSFSAGCVGGVLKAFVLLSEDLVLDACGQEEGEQNPNSGYR